MKLIISPKPGKDGVTYTVDFTVNSITPPYAMSKVLGNINKINSVISLFTNYSIRVVEK